MSFTRDGASSLSIRLVLFLHFMLGAMVLVAWVPYLTDWLAGPSGGSAPLPPFYDWSRFFHFPGKRRVLVAFVSASAALFAYTAAWVPTLAWLARMEWPSRAEGRLRLLTPFACAWLVQIVCLSTLRHTLQVSFAATIAFGCGWVVTVWAPIAAQTAWAKRHAWRLQHIERFLHRGTSVALLAGCAAAVAWVFVPLLTGDLRLLNDQLTAPEQTLLSTGPVSNLDYIRDHAIYGLHVGSATTTPADTARGRASYEFPVRMTPLLREWLSGQNAVQFDERRGVLTVFDLDADAFGSLEGALGSSTEREDLRRLYDLVNEERIYTAEEEEFIAKNWLELKWQMLHRWAVHHHNFVFGPMNELRLGKPSASISFQYGYVNAVGLIGLTELLGGFTLENYFRATWLFYPLYFVVLLAVTQILLRDRRYTALVAVVTVASMLSLDYEKILRAPGLSPLRHVLDVPVIALAAWSWRTRSRAALGGAYLLGLLEVALNREFGVVLLAALVGVEALHACQAGLRSQRVELIVAGLASAVGGGMLFAFRDVSNYMTSYYVSGFLSPPLPLFEMAAWLALFAAVYGVCIWPGTIDPPRRKVLLVLGLYGNGLFLYYIWGASSAHFQNIEPVYALLGAAGLSVVMSWSSLRGVEQRVLTSAQIVAAVVLLVPAGIGYQGAKADFDEVFRSHVVHSWNFPRVHARSTADPRPFEEAVSLIRQYEPTSKGVYFISVFDNILPMMADRYSAMPFFDLSWFLLTEREFALAQRRIADDKPAFLFVDHDILYDRAGEVADRRLRWDVEATHTESIIRIRRLQVLQELFRQVSGDYVKVAEGQLIDVYARRPL